MMLSDTGWMISGGYCTRVQNGIVDIDTKWTVDMLRYAGHLTVADRLLRQNQDLINKQRRERQS